MIKIPNVYNALATLSTKEDLAKQVTSHLRSAGYDDRRVLDYFEPQGAAICHAQAALFLSVSNRAREQLINIEQVKAFDIIIREAVTKWAALYKNNRASKTLTDHLSYYQ